jgi:hypothetical protein
VLGVAVLAVVGRYASSAALARRTGAIDPHAGVDANAGADACDGCHAEIVHEWRTSMHAASWDNRVFQAEYAIAPAVHCRECHAPAAEGIGCATCHVRDDAIVAFVAATDAESESRACGSCHDFAFPVDSRRHAPGDAMQSTLAEWRRSKAAATDRSCIDCHMPRRHDSARRDHSFRGLHDDEFLATAVDVEVVAEHDGALVVVHARLRPAAIGHAFPTGDMFRVARFVVEADGVSDEVVMRRHFAMMPTDDGSAMRLRQVDDTRLSEGSTTARLELRAPRATRVRWVLVIDRLDVDVAHRRGLELTEIRRVVAEGVTDVESRG